MTIHSAGFDARIFWGSDDPPAAELPPVCCGRCEHWAAVIATRGVCRWPAPETWPASFRPGLMAAADGASCPCFQLRAEDPEDRPASGAGERIILMKSPEVGSSQAGMEFIRVPATTKTPGAPGCTTSHQVAPAPDDLESGQAPRPEDLSLFAAGGGTR